MIELHDVYYAYGAGQPPAVAGITFSVEPRDFLVILGRNGSGKSTLAKIVSGVLVPNRGTVSIAGLDPRDPAQLRDIRRTVSLMLADPESQIVSPSVEEDVAFGPENLGLAPTEIEQRVEEALQAVALSAKRKSLTEFLSGGEKQRLAIAGLVAMRTPYLVLDEPTSMLDADSRREILDLLAQLNSNQGTGIVMTSHRAEEASWAKKVLVLDNGKIKAQGPPETILKDEELLADSGIDSPALFRLTAALKLRGFTFTRTILKPEEMVEELCQYVCKT